jgi:hypothetical protein
MQLGFTVMTTAPLGQIYTYTGLDNYSVVLAAVPEPNSQYLVVIGTAILTLMRFGHRKRISINRVLSPAELR